MVKKIILAVLAVFGSTTIAAAACNPPVIVVNQDGSREYISPEKNVMADMEALYGAAPQRDAMLVVNTRQRTGYWLERGTSADYIDVVVSEKSGPYTYFGQEECRPTDFPFDLFPDEPDDLGLQPRSGLWKATAGKPETRGCPAMIEQNIGQMTPAVPAQYLQPRRLEFAKPFHPDQLEMTKQMQKGLGTNIRWIAAGTEAWQAEVVPEIFGQIPQGEGGGSKMLWKLSVKSQTEIEHLVTLEIVLPAVALQMLGGGKGPCQIVTLNNWQRVGD